MPGKTQYYSNAVLNVLRNVGIDAVPQPYVGLFSTAPTNDSTSGTELTGDGYARQAITFGTPTAADANDQQITNTNTVTFGPATGFDWASAVGFGVFDSFAAGNLIYWSVLTTPKTLQVGDSGVWAVASLTITEG